MAHRVMLCMHFGLAARRETKKKGNEKLFDGVNQLFQKWGSEGIRLIGTFGNSAHTPGGFAHHAIFEIDSIDTVGKMDGDFMSADWNHMVESFELHLGTKREFIDKHFA
jgi:hypothetical protein